MPGTPPENRATPSTLVTVAGRLEKRMSLKSSTHVGGESNGRIVCARQPRAQVVHVRTLPCLLVSGGLGLVCFLYRYLSYDGFTNDHYVHLSRAQQILLGDVPVRDFVDPGLPLMYYASAAFQLAFGRTALSEAVLVFGALTVAAGITCWMALKLTGSYLVASGATLF